MYRLIFTDRALKSLKALQKREAGKIIAQLEELADSPQSKANVKCLQNHPRAVFRLRVGDYRVLFNKYNEFEVLEIIDVGHRKEIY
ncbi:MAG: type II toxin-antitoxin system RelE/ParE family toxin [Dyadobacter sp.]|uniref:type II toxin-antitoxin system RelE family toxin n=1 Tax=Dyadobacter sp. TaxID=1914288 RepID=UPI001B07E7C4|nr:type II toxin-antitoxin system RelE/ParE family toxin [Dyadobacter sp.]MBO9614607.1 type II toxin-antitoxin system RelE/ParE family toxin [Dyadobacter sp.]